MIEQYDHKTLVEMFDGKEVSPILPYESIDADVATIDAGTQASGRISISGVQPKNHKLEMNSIGQTIKKRRKELGLTQSTLALLSQVGINTIVSIERGSKSTSLETLLKVADVLGLEVQLQVKLK